MSARRGFIEKTLVDAGLAFDLSPGPEPIASFAVQSPDLPALNVTVRHTGPVLQLIAHGVQREPFSAQRFADLDVLGQTWSFGRIYHSQHTQAWELSVGLFAPERSAAMDPVLTALHSMADVAELVRGGPDRELLPLGPQLPPAAVMPTVERALAAAGLPPRPAHGGEVMAVALQMDRVRCGVEWFLADGTLLVARARPLGLPSVATRPDVLERLNALSGRLDIGGIGLWPELGTPYGWIAHPIASTEVTPDLVRWTSERAASWAEAAYEAAAARG